MGSMGGIGKILIFWGLILILLGFILSMTPNLRFLGKLPGDIIIKKDNFRFYFPLATCLIISLILTLLLNLFKK
jgi:hypothetical protein